MSVCAASVRPDGVKVTSGCAAPEVTLMVVWAGSPHPGKELTQL